MRCCRPSKNDKNIRRLDLLPFLLLIIIVSLVFIPAVNAIDQIAVLNTPGIGAIDRSPVIPANISIDPNLVQPPSPTLKKIVISVSANPSQIPVGSSASIMWRVTDSDGKPVQNVLLYPESDGHSTVKPNSGTTDSNGQLPATFSSAEIGTYDAYIDSFTPPAGYEKYPGPAGKIYITVVEAPKPKTVTISISANPSQILPDSSTSITVRVVDSDNKPVQNAFLTLDGGGGTLNPLSGNTNSNGQFPTDFKAVTKGIYTVQVVDVTPPSGYGKPASPYGSTSITVVSSDDPNPPPVIQPSITYQQPQYSAGQPNAGSSGMVPVQNYPPAPFFSVFPSSGQAPLNVSFDGSGSRDSDGYIKSWDWDFGDGGTGSGRTVTHVYQNAGTFTVTLLAKDNLAVSNTSSQQITASAPPVTPAVADSVLPPVTESVVPKENPFNWLPIIAMAAGILIIASGCGYVAWVHESLALQPQKKSVPCDGSSTIPIRVQFNNPFGRLRKQRKDREIELTSTSGTIQSVVIPAGKDFIEAVLTASTEGGVVTVTAQSDKKMAEAQVKFDCIEKDLEVEVTPSDIPADGVSTATVFVKVRNDKGKYVTSLSPRTIELKSTLGTIPTPLIVAPKSLSGTAILTAGKTVGTARVTASMGALTGASEVAITDLARRFCMHCGATMTMDATKCPKCGNTPPSGVDTKSCSTCGAVLPINAKFCDMCGARQPV